MAPGNRARPLTQSSWPVRLPFSSRLGTVSNLIPPAQFPVAIICPSGENRIGGFMKVDRFDSVGLHVDVVTVAIN